VSGAPCTMGSRTRRPCENEATVAYCGSGKPDVCEQHARDLDLAHDLEEFEIARDYVAGFAKVAEASACRRLMELMDLAWAECEMRLSVIEAERGMLWER
jgi:hypothetical protein